MINYYLIQVIILVLYSTYYIYLKIEKHLHN